MTDLRAAGYQPQPYQPDPDETVTCQACGKMNDSDAIYCDQCGAILESPGGEPYTAEPDETVECPECGCMNDTDARFCDQCGYQLAGSADVETYAAAQAELRFAVAPITHVDVRDPSGTDDNTWTMSGYAAVFNQTTILYDSKFIRLTESIDPGFFRSVLASQPLTRPDGVVHFNFGHDMNRAVAATDVPAGQPGSLILSTDSQGLRFLAKVPRDDPDGIAMASKMRSGVVRQASFAFTVAAFEDAEVETADGPMTEHRTLLDAKHLYDVCATAQGAYPQTVSTLRSYAAALGQPTPVGGHSRQPGLGGEIAVSPIVGGDETRTTPIEWPDTSAALAARRALGVDRQWRS